MYINYRISHSKHHPWNPFLYSMYSAALLPAQVLQGFICFVFQCFPSMFSMNLYLGNLPSLGTLSKSNWIMHSNSKHYSISKIQFLVLISLGLPNTFIQLFSLSWNMVLIHLFRQYSFQRHFSFNSKSLWIILSFLFSGSQALCTLITFESLLRAQAWWLMAKSSTKYQEPIWALIDVLSPLVPI